MAAWKYRPQLDGLRAVAILAVMAFHFHQHIAPGAYWGVQLFFALSGYLITGLLVAEFQATGKVAYADFYARRALRLYPALVLAVVLALGASTALGATHRPAGEDVAAAAASLVYVNDFLIASGVQTHWLDVTWSLSVEEQFYLIWPLVLLVALRRWSPKRIGTVCACLALAALCLQLPSRLLFGAPVTYFTPIGSVAPLLAGAAIALVAIRPSRSLAIGAVAAAVALAALSRWAPYPQDTSSYFGPIQLTVVCSVVLVAYFVGSPGPSLLSNSALVWVGRRSYGLYLYHQLVRGLFAGVFPDWREVYVSLIGIPLTFVLAALSYRFVEQPFLRRKKKHARVAEEAETERIVAGLPQSA